MTPAKPLLERDPANGRPKPKTWQVTFEMLRTVEVEADNAKDAEHKAREAVLFADENPVDREDIVHTRVGWINPEPTADQSVVHRAGCRGDHCRHYACDTRYMCSQCDVKAY